MPSPASDQERQPPTKRQQQSQQQQQQDHRNTPTAPPSSAQSSAPPDPPAAAHAYQSASTSHVATVTPAPTVGSAGPTLRDSSVEEEAEVPRDARLLYDAQGKLSKHFSDTPDSGSSDQSY